MPRARAPGRIRTPSEADIQTAIVIAIRRACPSVYVAAIPNGGSRHKLEAINMKRQGVRAGVPDLLIIGPTGTHGWLEVKKPGGSMRPDQVAFARMCEERGIPHAVVRCVDDALDALRSWGAEVKVRATA